MKTRLLVIQSQKDNSIILELMYIITTSVHFYLFCLPSEWCSQLLSLGIWHFRKQNMPISCGLRTKRD